MIDYVLFNPNIQSSCDMVQRVELKNHEIILFIFYPTRFKI